MGNDTIRPEQASGTPKPSRGPQQPGRPQVELDLVMEVLHQPATRPVLDALLMYPNALIEAAVEILARTKQPKTAETKPLTVPKAKQITAAEFFSAIPPDRPAKRQKYVFDPKLLDDPTAISTAESIANSRNYKKRKGKPLSAAEDARGKMFDSFVKQARRRHPRAEASPG